MQGLTAGSQLRGAAGSTEQGAGVRVGWVGVQGAGAAAWGARAQVRLESFEELTHVSFAILLGLKKKKKKVEKQI